MSCVPRTLSISRQTSRNGLVDIFPPIRLPSPAITGMPQPSECAAVSFAALRWTPRTPSRC